ncbi:hypothetical protein SETIT_5G255100v2 [Setaria italica]|uniref:Uncharacterized protein n=2 Tax=Setaria italica TaxID=4555 RepID=A0A368R8U2_SETIT|nr:hypothetical protein SETIT_5G255100v2 [Setaria italica]
MGSPMGSFLDLVSDHNLESDSEESQSGSTQVEEDLALLDVMSGARNFNHKRQKTSATASPGSSSPGSDESHADDEEEGLVAKAQYVETLENMWAKKREFETFKEDRKKERHDQIMELEKRKIELKEKDLELRQQIQDSAVMSMDISGMSERQQKYLLSLQDEIFARRFGAGSG